MLKKLRRKFVLVIMSVTAVILLAIGLALLVTTQRQNERMGLGLLQQALNQRPGPVGHEPFPAMDRLPPGEEWEDKPRPMPRVPVLVLAVDAQGQAGVVRNQLHFLAEEDLAPLITLVMAQEEDAGVLTGYQLRYLRRQTDQGWRVALADIARERDMLRTQMSNALLIGGGAMVLFFLLSLLLARWAVRPVEIAWEQQKQFLANASHELKTPLTVILSNADMLENTGDKEQNSRRVEHIHAEALRMKKLVEDMLTLAKSDTADKPTAFHPVDISDLVTGAVLVYEPIAFDEGKALTYAIAANLCLSGDAAKLRQVVHILLDNALKYAPVGGAIHVALAREEHKALLLTVENEGIPLPAEEWENIFLRFYRRDEARSTHGSYGLGLSIAQTIVQSHQGKIWAGSDGLSRNKFSVTLPL